MTKSTIKPTIKTSQCWPYRIYRHCWSCFSELYYPMFHPVICTLMHLCTLVVQETSYFVLPQLINMSSNFYKNFQEKLRKFNIWDSFQSTLVNYLIKLRDKITLWLNRTRNTKLKYHMVDEVALILVLLNQLMTIWHFDTSIVVTKF